ncbi:MAG: serine protease [Myxococcales bacterium]|nr:serine protease [Myxococcales bacterium]
MCCGIACVLLGLASSARGDVHARRIVALLDTPSRRHPLAAEDGRIPLLVRVPPGVSARARGLLPLGDGLAAVHLDAAALPAFLQANPDLAPTVSPPRRALLDASGAITHAPAFRVHTGLDGTGAVVGIIDTGIDAAHADFRDAEGKTRIAWLIQRGKPRGLHPELEERFGCTAKGQSPCAILAAADIDALLASAPSSAPRDPTGHGTHVASIAAGNGGLANNPLPTYAGVAPGATLIVAAPSSAGFSDPDIINAARFIFDRADALHMPAVVNVSLGSDYGPHDGTSELERGLAALIGDGEPGRAMVVAAGNSGALYTFGERGPYGVHTEARSSEHATTRVPIGLPGLAGKIDGAGFVWLTFRPGDEVSVGLDGPGGLSISPVAPGADGDDEDDGDGDDDDLRAVVVNAIAGAQAGIAADSNSAVVSFSGKWDAGEEIAILLRGRGDAQLWVAGTGDAGPGVGLGVMFERAVKFGTVGVPATHPELIAVGCTLNRKRWRPLGAAGSLELASFGGVAEPMVDSLCYFSGAGPTATGVMKPDLVAPGAFVAAAMSHDADPRSSAGSIFSAFDCPDEGDRLCHLVDETHAINSGTSMSAPQVSGAIALIFGRDPTLTQRELRDLLTASVARPRGLVPFDYQQGSGELQLDNVLAVLDSLPSLEPSVAHSYFVLGAPYLRPDPSHEVAGVVELRDAKDAVVSSVADGELTLRLHGGVASRPLTRVHAGMWRFAIAAERGTGGGAVTVEVLFRGQAIGKRVMPIAVDAWAVGSGVNAVGGCSVTRMEGGRRGECARGVAIFSELAVLLGAFGALRVRRRTRRAESCEDFRSV